MVTLWSGGRDWYAVVIWQSIAWDMHGGGCGKVEVVGQKGYRSKEEIFQFWVFSLV
jgi:hypothetical protein